MTSSLCSQLVLFWIILFPSLHVLSCLLTHKSNSSSTYCCSTFLQKCKYINSLFNILKYLFISFWIKLKSFSILYYLALAFCLTSSIICLNKNININSFILLILTTVLWWIAYYYFHCRWGWEIKKPAYGHPSLRKRQLLSTCELLIFCAFKCTIFLPRMSSPL